MRSGSRERALSNQREQHWLWLPTDSISVPAILLAFNTPDAQVARCLRVLFELHDAQICRIRCHDNGRDRVPELNLRSCCRRRGVIATGLEKAAPHTVAAVNLAAGVTIDDDQLPGWLPGSGRGSSMRVENVQTRELRADGRTQRGQMTRSGMGRGQAGRTSRFTRMETWSVKRATAATRPCTGARAYA